MRILFVSPSNAIGGAEMSLLEMAKYLHAKGHSVFVAMPPSSDCRYEALLQPFVRQFLIVPMMPWNRLHKISWLNALKGWTKRIWTSRGAYCHSVPRLIRFIRKHQIDLVHTNTIMALDGALAAKIAGIPHVQHLREITGYRPDALFPMLGQRWPSWFGGIWGNLHKAFIANSIYTQEAYADYISVAKIRVVYNTVETGVQTVRNLPVNTAKTIGLVANVTSKVKKHRFFIQLAGKLSKVTPNLDFVIFGKMPPENDSYLYGLKAEIAHQNISKKLNFKGLCADIDAMYERIDVLCHCYPYESFGRIFIEAMAHGVPVVAVRGGGADELIVDGENGFLFEIGDLETAARKVRALCEDHLLYARIAQNAQEFARQFHSEVTGAALLEVYQEILH